MTTNLNHIQELEDAAQAVAQAELGAAETHDWAEVVEAQVELTAIVNEALEAGIPAQEIADTVRDASVVDPY